MRRAEYLCCADAVLPVHQYTELRCESQKDQPAKCVTNHPCFHAFCLYPRMLAWSNYNVVKKPEVNVNQLTLEWINQYLILTILVDHLISWWLMKLKNMDDRETESEPISIRISFQFHLCRSDSERWILNQSLRVRVRLTQWVTQSLSLTH